MSLIPIDLIPIDCLREPAVDLAGPYHSSDTATAQYYRAGGGLGVTENAESRPWFIFLRGQHTLTNPNEIVARLPPNVT